MAKFKYSQNIEDSIDFDGDLGLQIKQQHHKAIWTDDQTGAQIILGGKGFQASEEDTDRFSGGTIHKIVITDGDQKVVVTITHLNIKATDLQAVWDDNGIVSVASYLARGNDTVVGSGEGDYLLGSAGNDRMTGKGGSDYFEFQYASLKMAEGKSQPEHDVITDFDLKGEDADHLGIHQEFTYKGVHQGHDTMLIFEDDSTLLLEGVKKTAFQQYLESQPE